MRLDYNVLWIDDRPRSVRVYQRSLSDLNEEIGIETTHQNFEIRLVGQETPQEHRYRISSSLKSTLDENLFELIVVDLHMTGNVGGFDGDDIVEFIRDSQKIFRPIIFHSAGEPAADKIAQTQLNTAATESGVFGKSVFITTRGRLKTMLKNIAKEMHEHEHQINQVRGTLMDCVSEIDALIIQIIMDDKIWKKLPENSQNKALKVFKDLSKSKLKTECRKYKSVRGMNYDEVRAFISADPTNVNTFAKAKLLRELAKEIPEIADNGKILSEFLISRTGEPICLTDIRNAYAHKTAEILDQNHNKEHCTYIRQQARRHRENINELKDKL